MGVEFSFIVVGLLAGWLTNGVMATTNVDMRQTPPALPERYYALVTFQQYNFDGEAATVRGSGSASPPYAPEPLVPSVCDLW